MSRKLKLHGSASVFASTVHFIGSNGSPPGGDLFGENAIIVLKLNTRLADVSSGNTNVILVEKRLEK